MRYQSWKAQQNVKRDTKVLTNSEKTGYQKRPVESLYFERNERLDPYNNCDPRQDNPDRFQEASPSPAGRHF